MGPRWRHVLEPLSGGPLYGYPVFTPVLGYFAPTGPRRPLFRPHTPCFRGFLPLSTISLKSHPNHFNFFRHLPAILLLFGHFTS